MSKIDLRKLKRSKRYTVKELAETFGIAPTYFYYLINHQGLPRFEMYGKYYIYGKEFFMFVKEKRNKKKLTHEKNEMLCLRCRNFRVPVKQEVKIVNVVRNTNTNGVIRIVGICPVCGREFGKFSNQTQLKNISKTFNVVEELH